MIISKEELVANISSEISDNSKGEITPFDIRHNFLDLIDSVHNLTEFNNLKSKNFSTQDGSRTTRIGDSTLDYLRRGVPEYTSVDNTAVGYASLNKNYQGSENTAVGSYALNCNIHGHNNVGVGFNAVAANTLGYGNVGIGSYALHNNKEGNLNIAIGHGAGYYIGRNQSERLFIASHNVDTDYICSNEDGVGLIPLIEGDLRSSNLRLGIAVTGLHEGATLQVGGSIHPTKTSNYDSDLGSDTYRFRDVYLSNTLYFAEENYIRYDSIANDFIITSPIRLDGSIDVSGNLDVQNDISINGSLSLSQDAYIHGSLDVDSYIKVSGDLTPKNHLQYRLGYGDRSWLSANIHNLTVTGNSVFNKFEAVEQAHYLHKTIFLASSGYINTIDGGGPRSLTQNYHPNDNIEPPVGYLKDEELFGAGLNIYSKDVAAGYNRTYSFAFRNQDETLNFLSKDDAYSRSHWTSNISIETTDGNHVKTDRIINKSKLGLLNYNTGLGIFINRSSIDIGKESNIIDSINSYGDFNIFIDTDKTDYITSIISPNNTTNLHQRLFSNSISNSVFNGFEFSVINKDSLDAPDFFNPAAGQSYDRLVLRSYKNKANASRSFVFMNEGNDGFIGINNFDRGEYLIPDTILNIRSVNDAVVRIAAENTSQTKAGIQLLTTSNCLDYGLDLYYDNSSKSLFGDLYHNSVATSLIKANYQNKHFGIFVDNAEPNAMLTIGSQINSDAYISMSESDNFASPTERYGKIFVRSVDRDSQSSTLSYVDGSGNYFDFSLSAITSEGGGEPLDIYAFADAKRNTMVGRNSPASRAGISTANDNTSLGYSSFSSIFTGDRNTCIGSYAGSSSNGSVNDNILIGYKAGDTSLLLSSNIIIGNDVSSHLFVDFNNEPVGNKVLIDNSIEIHKNETKTLNSIDRLVNDVYLKNSVLITTFGTKNSNGVVTPANSVSIDPYIGRVSYVYDDTDESLNNQKTLDCYINNSPVTRTYSSAPNISPPSNLNYNTSSNSYFEIYGDLRLTGNILWSNGTKINSGQIQQDVEDLQQGLTTTNANLENESQRIDNLNADLASFITEGYSDGTILPPEDANSPTFGNLTTKIKNGSSWVNGPKIQIVNRDKFMRISRGDFVVVIKVNGEYRPIFVSYGS